MGEEAAARAPGDLTGCFGLLARTAAEASDRLILTDLQGRALTVGALYDAALATAAGLAGLGVGAGTRVAWMFPSRIEAAVLAFALGRLGARQVPMVPIWREREVTNAVSAAAVDVVVTAAEHAEVVAAAEPRAVVTVTGGDVPTGDPRGLPAFAIDPDAVGWVFFTSGTSARPKGVLHRDRALVAAGRGYFGVAGLGAGDVLATTQPLAHVGGMTMLTGALHTGSALALIETFDLDTCLEWLPTLPATHLVVPVVLARAVLDRVAGGDSRFPHPRLRALLTGGGPTPPGFVDEFEAVTGVPVARCYGLTEAPNVVGVVPTHADRRRIDAEGMPCGDAEITARDGELLVRGPQLMAGYLDGSEAADRDGWFRTGDLGMVDADGWVNVTGRSKQVIIRKGETISAVEVESVLARHPAVAEVAVLALPDPISGERACAVVVRRPGRDLTLAELGGHCLAAGLARQKAPEQLELVDELPRSPLGKVQLAVLRERFTTAP